MDESERLNEIARDPPLIPWRLFGLFQSERNHKNKPYAQKPQTQDQVSRPRLIKVQ